MPHCIIGNSSDVVEQVAIDNLMVPVRDGVFSSALFPEYDIKTRAVAYRQHRTGLEIPVDLFHSALEKFRPRRWAMDAGRQQAGRQLNGLPTRQADCRNAPVASRR